MGNGGGEVMRGERKKVDNDGGREKGGLRLRCVIKRKEGGMKEKKRKERKKER